jgi:hypothetical protein
MKLRFCAVLILSFVLLFGCAQKRPVLYPNAHMNQVGAEAAERDIELCLQAAEAAGVGTDRGEAIGRSTAAGALMGVAVGAATGAVFGNIGRGAAAGALGGAAAGGVRGGLQSGERDPVFRNFVDRCLREKGYDPIGWR